MSTLFIVTPQPTYPAPCFVRSTLLRSTYVPCTHSCRKPSWNRTLERNTTNWQIGNSSSGMIEAPLWSYQLKLENGWMPTDPRKATGKCITLGSNPGAYPSSYQPWQTGGAGAGRINPNPAAPFTTWAPAPL